MAHSSARRLRPPSVPSNIEARPYQLELLYAAIEDNTIVLLGTGGGKTFIAVMLIKELSQNITKPFTDSSAKRTVFLVNTVPLATQQARYIETHTGFSVGVYVGMDVMSWSQDKWMEELNQHYVLVMTHDLFQNHLLTTGHLPLSRVNLLIFDECHHATKNHPYAQIMKRFSSCSKEKWPHILGLSASIISGKCKPGMLSEKLKALEETLHCRIETARDLREVSCYVTNPKESFAVFSPCGSSQTVSLKECLERALQCFDDRVPTVKKDSIKDELRSSLTDCVYVLENVNISSALSAAEIASAEVRMMLEDKLEDEWKRKLVQMTLTSLACFSEKCNAILRAKGDDNSPKLTRLLQILAETNPQLGSSNSSGTQDNLRGIIFVQRRSTAVCLANVIRKFKSCFPHIQCYYIVGHNSRLRKTLEVSAHMSIAKQEEVLRKFRTGSINLLVATSVVEEGLDVPKCNLVVRYDFPVTFQSYVQSKGRARAKNSRYRLLVEQEKCEEYRTKLDEYCALEQELQKICHDRDVPDEDAIERRMKHLIPPYKPYGKNDSPEVTVDQSLSLLHRYCQMLPHDRYTVLAPDFQISGREGICPLDNKMYPKLFLATVSLPMCCPVKESIQGLPIPHHKLARKSAALKAVERLHQAGELDDYLKPRSHKRIDSDEEDQEKMAKKKEVHAGTNRRVMYYRNAVPTCLQHCQPVPGAGNQLYVFHIRERESGKLYCAQNETMPQQTLGIITRNKIPWRKIPQFSLYVKKTELSVSLFKNPTLGNLSSSELEKARIFHKVLFTRILGMAGAQMQFDPAYRGYVIVPLQFLPDPQLQCFLDMDMLDSVVSMDSREVSWPSCGMKAFLDALVTKNYAEERVHSAEQLYEVTSFNREEYPYSKFPNSEDLTYAQYFQQKYNYEFKGYNQHSLTCRPLGMGERSMQLTVSQFKDSVPKTTTERGEIKLFPELCKIHQLPASFWKLCRCIPSLVHRFEALLVAEDFSSEGPNIGELWHSDGKEFMVTTYTELRGHQDHAVGPLRTACYQKNISGDVMEDMVPSSEVTAFIQVSWRKPDNGILLQALTPSGAMDSIDLERLEALGDSFLKLVTSIDLYCTRSGDHEGKLTQSRTNRISNFNLAYLARKKGIPGMIQSKRLEPLKTWLPPSFIVNRFDPNLPPLARSNDLPIAVRDYLYHRVTDKGVADVVEALIGSYIVAGGIEAGLQFLEWLGLKLDCSIKDGSTAMEHSLQTSADAMSVDNFDSALMVNTGLSNPLLTRDADKIFSYRYSLPQSLLEEGVNNNQIVNKLLVSACYAALCEKLKWPFVDDSSKALLLQALTHPSYVKNRVTESYQRLEFLGDAILDYLVTCSIYCHFPDYTPGQITDLRSALVSNVTLAQIAVQKLGINHHILHLAPALFRQIQVYYEGLCRTFSEEEKEEVQNIYYCNCGTETPSVDPDSEHGMRVEPNQASSCGIEDDEDVEELDPPKALGDVMESLIGAVFLDSGMSLLAVWDVFQPFFEPLIEEYSRKLPLPPVRELYEREREPNIQFQKEHVGDLTRGKAKHRCIVIVHDKNIHVSAVAKTAKAAKRMAARKALLRIDEMQEQDNTH